MAKEGNLRIPLKLSCRTYEMREVYGDEDFHSQLALVILYKDKPLGHTELNHLHNAKWFNIILEELSIQEVSENQVPLFDANEKTFSLLDCLNIKEIKIAHFNSFMDIEKLLNKCHIKELYTYRPLSSSFFLSPHLSKIKVVHITTKDDYANEDNRRILECFVLNSLNEDLSVNYVFSPSILSNIIERWCSGEKSFKRIRLSTNVDGVAHLSRNMRVAFPREGVDHKLKEVKRDKIQELVDINKPSVVFGTDNGMIIIRENLDILRVISYQEMTMNFWTEIDKI